MNTNSGLQLDPRAQATMNALAGVVLDPSVHRTNAIAGLVVCGFFIVLFLSPGLVLTPVMFFKGGLVPGLLGLTFFLFPGGLAALPGFIAFRLMRVLRALPK